MIFSTTTGRWLVLLVLLSAGPHTGIAAGQATVRGTVAWYMEQEAGIEPYRVRYIVTDDFMRSDEAGDEGAFTLFDREQRHIYSVVPDNRMVLQIDASGSLPAPPSDLSFKIVAAADDQAPRIGGDPPLKVDLLADGLVCHSALVSTKLMPALQQAMQAFAQALAVYQARTLQNTPTEYQTPCFLLRYVYASDFHWLRGAVLADWNSQGARRELVDYQLDVELPAALFEVPDDYRRLPAGGH